MDVWTSIWCWLGRAAGALGAWLAYLMGGWDAALGIMFLAMGLDYVTGILCALMGKSPKTDTGGFKSSVAFAGLTRKMMMLIIVMVATLLDRLIGTDGVCRIAAIGFYVANEGMSIIENASAMGVPFPQGLLDTLQRLRDKSNGTSGMPEDTTKTDETTTKDDEKKG